ncbi:MAG: 4-hydroxy-tetrahydrodipicolinate reductase [Phycisphaerales bacterium]|nr:MAG: 4-hydroxy-tetrahydrodipicolinate reductase [Phycisphaerales bacterium]
MSGALSKTTTRVTIVGAAGRMGKRVVALAGEDPAFQLSAALEHGGHPLLGRDSGDVAGVGSNGIVMRDHTDSDFDVLIDFSLPAGTMHWLDFCLHKRRAFVTGVTGLADEHMTALEEAAVEIPVLQAPNMSTGINLLLRLAHEAARVLGDYDVEIVEAHHRFKRDAPSGTAAALLQAVCDGRETQEAEVVFGRHGGQLDRPQSQIGMHSLRGGDNVGEHKVLFCGLGEMMTLRHRATSRDTFVRGALRAAAWIKEKPAGRYSMQDVLFGSRK